MHQCAKGEPNQFTDGTVIGPNAHTCSPPCPNFFTTFYHKSIYLSIFIYMYLDLYIYISKGQMKISQSLQTNYYPICIP